MAKYKVKDHKELEIESFKIIETKTRANIAYGILAFSALTIISACIYGILKDNFSGVKDVMIFILPVVTFILGHYFGGQNRNEKFIHDESSNGTT